MAGNVQDVNNDYNAAAATKQSLQPGVNAYQGPKKVTAAPRVSVPDGKPNFWTRLQVDGVTMAKNIADKAKGTAKEVVDTGKEEVAAKTNNPKAFTNAEKGTQQNQSTFNSARKTLGGAANSIIKPVVKTGADVTDLIDAAESHLPGYKGSKTVEQNLQDTKLGGAISNYLGKPDNVKQMVGNAVQTGTLAIPAAGKSLDLGGEFLLKQIGETGVRQMAEKAGITASEDATEQGVSKLSAQVAKSELGKSAIKSLATKGSAISWLGKLAKNMGEGAAGFGAFNAGAAASNNESGKQIVKSGVQGAELGAILGAAGTVVKGAASKVREGKLQSAGVDTKAMQDTEKATQEAKGSSQLKSKTTSETPKTTSLKTPAEKKTSTLGETGAVNPGQATEDIKKFIDNYHQVKESSGDITRDTVALKNKVGLLQHDAAKTGKNFSSSQSDREAADRYLEAKGAGQPTEKLTDKQQQIVDNVRAMQKEIDSDKATLATENGRPIKSTGEGVHRIALGKGSSLERFMKGARSNPVNSRSLRTTVDSDQSRKLLAVTDENGNRSVVHIANQTVKSDKGKIVSQGKMVNKLENGGKKVTPLGRLKLTTDADKMDKELSPVKRQLDNLNNEKRILTGSKGRQAASPQRLANIDDKINALNDQHENIINKYDSDNLDKKSFTGSDGHTYTVGQATKDEITAGAGQKYLIHPELATLDDMVRTKQALYSSQVLNKWKESPDFGKIAVKTGTEAPKGWKGIDIPQLKGYNFAPRVADTLNMLYKGADTDDDWISKSNRLIRNTIVAVPIKHTLNEGVTNVIDRGVSGVIRLPSQSKNLIRAIDEVHNTGPLWRQVLESGAHMTSLDSDSFAKMVKSQLDGVFDNKDAVEDLGKVISSPLKAYKAFQRGTVWVSQDVLNMSRILDRMGSNGGDLDKAIRDTEKFNLTYSPPAKVLGSKKIGNMLRGSNSILFGTYRYDLFRINANYLKTAINVTDPKAALKAADSLAMEALVVGLMGGAVKAGIDKLTGNKNSYMSAPGVAGLAQDVYQLAKGKETTTQFGQQQIYPSWLVSSALQVQSNRDSFTGQPIVNTADPVSKQLKSIASWLYSQTPVAEDKTNANKGGSVLGGALSFTGVRSPTNPPAVTKYESLYYDQAEPTYEKFKAEVKAGNTSNAKQIANTYNNQLVQAYQQAYQATYNKSISAQSASMRIQAKYDSPWISMRPHSLASAKKTSIIIPK